MVNTGMGMGTTNDNDNYESDAGYSGSGGSYLSPSENFEDGQNDILSAEEELNRGSAGLTPDSECDVPDESFR